MTEDKLEGTGLPAHGLVFLDVSLVLAPPLYLYVELWGRNLEQKPPQSRFHPKGKSPSRTPGPDARVPGVWTQTPGTLASGPWAPQNFLLHFPKASWAFPFGPDKVFSCPNISGNIRNSFRWIPEPFRRSNTTIHISIFTSGPFRNSS